jgi:hypothetical protein
MITKEEYEMALIVIREFESQQKELINKDRITIELFISKIQGNPSIGSVRLLNCLDQYLWMRKEKPHWLNNNIKTYIDELTRDDFRRIRNAGKKTWDLFLVFKENILK